MQRLFWKFFLSFWTALILFSGVVMLAASHYVDQMRERGDINPFAQLLRLTGEAQRAADRGGLAGLKGWARKVDRLYAVPFLVLNAGGRDLLGRPVPERIAEHFIRRNNGRASAGAERPRFHRLTIRLHDGTRFHLLPDFQGVTLGRILSRPRVIALPLLIAALISALVCLILARYLVRPIERLRRATEIYAAGDLSQRVGPSLGRRRDEIVDLAHAFDRMAERLEVLMQSQRQLLTDVSHELRSPLARLQAALGLARQRAGDRAQPDLDRIDRESERLNELIGQLLSLARLESGVQMVNMESLDLVELLETVVADASLEADARQRKVQLTTQGSALMIHGNPALLHSALENVVRNAIRYTGEHTTVSIHLYRDPTPPERATIVVRDHGPGVPDEMLPRLFEPFVRVGDDRDRSSGGYGIGLAIAERAVRLHGGDIAASNEPDGGLTVSIRLPVAPRDR